MPHAALNTLKKLAGRYRLIVVTSRPPSWRKATERWLEEHYPGIFSQVFFTRQSDGVDHETKGDVCEQHGADWLIDDNVEHAMSAHEKGIEVILFGDYGWHHTVPPHFTRCKTWADVLEYFDVPS
jgi:uncharacterized HAD superfamily protein